VSEFLTVSERFYSLQGEGATMGVPSVFLRLAGCNLLCQSKTWVCDTIEVWQKGIKTPFHEVLQGEDCFDRLHQGAHLVITGGEPLLHQRKLVHFLKWFELAYGWLPFIEVETNGTIMPDDYLLEIVKQWNCSPKLSNSGEPNEKRFKPLVLDTLNQFQNTIFKFVVGEESDIVEVISEFSEHISSDKLCLMPAGETQEKLAKTRLIAADAAIKLGIRYSERLHIVIWNQKTGV
tara:strand:- start:64 stop:765 length:702 start_codon:yes stop_codon:yes gene_type:complete